VRTDSIESSGGFYRDKSRVGWIRPSGSVSNKWSVLMLTCTDTYAPHRFAPKKSNVCGTFIRHCLLNWVADPDFSTNNIYEKPREIHFALSCLRLRRENVRRIVVCGRLPSSDPYKFRFKSTYVLPFSIPTNKEIFLNIRP